MNHPITFKVLIADDTHHYLAPLICEEIAASAKARGTGIARRTPEFVINKMKEGKAVVALTSDGAWAGFCYIETWSNGEYVANSGLIVSPEFRKSGLAKVIKKKIFDLSRTKYPEAKIFGLTTGLAVMKINSDLGYEPVTYSEITQDENFWKGCESCVNHEILKSKNRKNCLCTAMMFNPADLPKNDEATSNIEEDKQPSGLSKWFRKNFKQKTGKPSLKKDAMSSISEKKPGFRFTQLFSFWYIKPPLKVKQAEQ